RPPEGAADLRVVRRPRPAVGGAGGAGAPRARVADLGVALDVEPRDGGGGAGELHHEAGADEPVSDVRPAAAVRGGGRDPAAAAAVGPMLGAGEATKSPAGAGFGA